MFYRMIFLLGIPVMFALKCELIERKPSKQAELYNPSKGQFHQHVQKQFHINDHLPDVCYDAVRMMSFDIHRLRDEDAHIFKTVLTHLEIDLNTCAPTIVALQRVPQRGMVSRDALERSLHSRGYKHIVSTNFSDNYTDTLLASKIEIKNSKTLQIGRYSSAVSAIMSLGGKKILFISATLENATLDIDRFREFCQKQIKDLEKIRADDVIHEYVVLGNFGFTLATEQMHRFLNDCKLRDAFASLSWPPPTYSHQSGKTIDHILVSPSLQNSLFGAHAFQTTTTIHIPIIADLNVPRASDYIESSSVFARSNWVIFILSGLFLIFWLVVGLYYWGQNMGIDLIE